MNPAESQPVRFLVIRAPWLDYARSLAALILRHVVTLAVLGGCTYLVFWRGESGWLYVPALFLARFAR